MVNRCVFTGLSAVVIVIGMIAAARATVVNPSAMVSGEMSNTKGVRWVCGPYRCAYIAGYTGAVVVRPYMRTWVPPPRPHCNYVRGPRGRWALVCP